RACSDELIRGNYEFAPRQHPAGLSRLSCRSAIPRANGIAVSTRKLTPSIIPRAISHAALAEHTRLNPIQMAGTKGINGRGIQGASSQADAIGSTSRTLIGQPNGCVRSAT